MKRRLQFLALCAAALLAMRMMAQDTGAGGGEGGGNASGDTGGASSGDNSGAATSPGNSGASSGANGENNNGGTTNGNSTTNGGTGTQGEGGTGTTSPGTGILTIPGTGGAATIEPSPSPAGPTGPTLLPPGTTGPVPGATPAPATPSPTPIGPNTVNPAAAGSQAAPVTFNLPGGYGGSTAPQSFTLGQGRLAKPPITFSATISQGYDSNVFSAPSNFVSPKASPTPTPPLETVIVQVPIFPGSPVTLPVPYTFRPTPVPTPKPTPLPETERVIGSPVTSANVGAQAQVGTPRTVVTADLSVGEQTYWDEPGGGTNYTGSFDLALVHKLTPRATLSMEGFATYQNSPNFALVNAPTNAGSNQNYLDGTLKADLSYAWGGRFSTVTSYDFGFNIEKGEPAANLYTNTLGTQFRYTVSPRNTVTAELREAITTYPSNSGASTVGTYYLLGLDTFFSSRFRNSFSVGIQTNTFTTGAGSSAASPYFEGTATLALPRGASLAWTNTYGFQPNSTAGATTTSYRTGLTYQQPLSTKLVATITIAYNNLQGKDPSNPAGAYTQNQLQASAGLNYTISSRLSLSLSYNYLDLLSSQVNGTYQRDQVYLGGSYVFR
jgi:hypothetical protein